MNKILHEIFGGLPFLMMTTNGIKPNYNRIIEAVIIAGIAGFIASQLTVSELKMKLTFQETQITRVEQRITETCDILMKNQQEIVRIDTLQKERLERERMEQHLRKTK